MQPVPHNTKSGRAYKITDVQYQVFGGDGSSGQMNALVHPKDHSGSSKQALSTAVNLALTTLTTRTPETIPSRPTTHQPIMRTETRGNNHHVRFRISPGHNQHYYCSAVVLLWSHTTADTASRRLESTTIWLFIVGLSFERAHQPTAKTPATSISTCQKMSTATTTAAVKKNCAFLLFLQF